MLNVPLLDYAKYATGTVTERLQFAHDLTEAFKDYGFVRLLNHGIPEEQIQDSFKWCDRFFELPLQTKQRLEVETTPNPQRGYLSYAVESTSPLTRLHPHVEHLDRGKKDAELIDERESFTFGPPEDTEFPNVWPDESDLPGFKDFAENHFERCRAICLHLIEAMAMGLNIPARALLDRCVPDHSDARLHFYPESSVASLNSGTNARVWPHTDFGIITLLLQDGVGGLEIEDRPNGRKFIPLTTTPPGAPSELVVNTGDCMQRWTNNVIQSGLHQVSIPPNLKRFTDGVVPRRLSCPFFLEANYDKSVGPLPHFVSEQRPAAYDEITRIEYHRRRIETLYTKSPVATAT